MDSYERKKQYIELMRASLRAAASGDATKAIQFCRKIEELAHDTIRAAKRCDHSIEKKLLLDVVQDAVSFLARSGAEVGQAGPNEVSKALSSAAGRIVTARKHAKL